MRAPALIAIGFTLCLVVLGVGALTAGWLIQSDDAAPPVTYSQFLKQVETGQVQSAVVHDDSLEVTLKRQQRYEVGFTEGARGFVLDALHANGVAVQIDS